MRRPFLVRILHAVAVLLAGFVWPYASVLVAALLGYGWEHFHQYPGLTGGGRLLFLHAFNSVPFLVLAALLIGRKEPGLVFWFAAVPTFAWMFGLHASYTRFGEMYGVALLSWPFIGAAIALAGAGLGLLVVRVWRRWTTKTL